MWFKYRKGYDWLDLNSKQEGVGLVGFKYQKDYDWLDLNSKQEGVRLVGFKYQKGYDWLDSQFHCSYLESRRVPGKTREIRGKRGKLSPFHFRFPVHDFWFRWRHIWWRHFRWRHFRWCNFRWRHFRWRSPTRSPTNNKWMVPLYY